eukprot:CAMPEP_0117445964 /NCGR_PEP_ID=MMETSP0759-20121206/6081_1 /TAXON_ID=63605 /ORGANISM="Percolomonas cosmopolitus, Strain WS" /LENGTH=329 /DNA_ID=CAMNT_0005238185 /DNA_START=319 /DNA_END=1308 /DNA_ORIENTATION=+
MVDDGASAASSNNYDTASMIQADVSREYALAEVATYSLHIVQSTCTSNCKLDFVLNQARVLDTWNSPYSLNYTNSESSIYLHVKRLASKLVVQSSNADDRFVFSLRDGDLPTVTKFDSLSSNVVSFSHEFNFWETISGDYYAQIRVFNCTQDCAVTATVEESWFANFGASVGKWVTDNLWAAILIGVAIVVLLCICITCSCLLFCIVWNMYVCCGVRQKRMKKQRSHYVEMGDFTLKSPDTLNEEKLTAEKYMDSILLKKLQEKHASLSPKAEDEEEEVENNVGSTSLNPVEVKDEQKSPIVDDESPASSSSPTVERDNDELEVADVMV